MVNDNDSVQLAEYCFNVRDTLKTSIQGKRVGDLDESVRMVLGGLERCVD